MRSINIHEAKTHLSRLVEEAARGDGFIIAKAGKPMVQVVCIDAAPVDVSKRLGLLQGKFKVPDDFDTMFVEEIRAMFEDGPLFPDEGPDDANT
jgi:prevent-host-death family protein